MIIIPVGTYLKVHRIGLIRSMCVSRCCCKVVGSFLSTVAYGIAGRRFSHVNGNAMSCTVIDTIISFHSYDHVCFFYGHFYTFRCSVRMISITLNHVPDIIGSGVGFCRDICGIKVFIRRSSFLGGHGIYHFVSLRQFGCRCIDQPDRISGINDITACLS